MPDRRIQRTKSNIYSALVSLLLEKDIGNITVKELCEQADVNKSTFYLHFMDIYDCKDKWQNEMFGEILAKVDNFSLQEIIKAPEVYINGILAYFESNLTFYKKLATSPLAAEFSYMLKEKLTAKINEANVLDLKHNRYEATMVAFIMGGLFDACLINIADFNTENISTVMTDISNAIVKFIRDQK